jgi:hypothetical protein
VFAHQRNKLLIFAVARACAIYVIRLHAGPRAKATHCVEPFSEVVIFVRYVEFRALKRVTTPPTPHVDRELIFFNKSNNGSSKIDEGGSKEMEDDEKS